VAEGPVPLTLDAAHGEGGGQVLRTALALAVALGRPVTLERIRLRRPRAGLQPQHLTVVRALATISAALVEGDRLGSTALSFTPRRLGHGDWRFDVGAVLASAGSVPLLFQALLLALVWAGAKSRLTLIGGTHVPWSPTAHYLSHVFLSALAPLGVGATVRLRRCGWYPAGGGEIEAVITPTARIGGLTAIDRRAPAQAGRDPSGRDGPDRGRHHRGGHPRARPGDDAVPARSRSGWVLSARAARRPRRASR
jgi:RNA 3'-terminal phosphate cyclase (ATP)